MEKKKIKAPNETTIYIGNLNYRRDESAVKKMFDHFGKVIFVNLIKDPKTKKRKGMGFVKMINSKDANRAIEYLNGRSVDGRTLKVSIAKEREENRK